MKITSIIGIFFITALAACHDQAPAPAATVAKPAAPSDSDRVSLSAVQIKNAGIELGQSGERTIHSTLKVSGALEAPPENFVSVSVPLGGYLKKMSLIPGQPVQKGAVLAMLEDQQYIQLQQDYLTAKSRLQFLETDYNRQKGLNETKATSDKVLQQVQSDFNGQKILLAALAEKLRLIGIKPELLNETNISRTIPLYSPINGYVTKINVNMGKYVSPTDVLFELVDPSDLHLTLTVFENDAAYLSVGQKLVCYTNNKPDVKYAATIHMITPSIGEGRSTEVHCDLDKIGKELMPGMFMNAAVELNNKKVTAVADDAIVKWEGRYYVFLAEKDQSFRLTPVETGASDGGFTEIRSNLPAGRVVTKNAYTLLMKMKNSGEED